MKCITVLFGAIFLAFIFQACGNVSSDSVPQMPPNERITGIIVTSADNRIIGEIGDPSAGGDADGKRIVCTNGTGRTDDEDGFAEIPS